MGCEVSDYQGNSADGTIDMYHDPAKLITEG